MTVVVEVVDATRRFVGRAETITAVDRVGLEVAAGQVVAIVGPSGSGKSTLLHLVAGWERPDSGEVRLAAEVRERPGWAGLAIVPQDLGLLGELTGGQNVALALRLAGVDEDPVPTLARLGVAELVDRLPAETSLGEQQRFAVARAVASSPALVVADEPTAHQDERHADVVMEVLRDVARAGGAVVVATHDDRLLESVDTVVRLIDGRVAQA